MFNVTNEPSKKLETETINLYRAGVPIRTETLRQSSNLKAGVKTAVLVDGARKAKGSNNPRKAEEPAKYRKR